jgi:hypothetical protein
MLLKKLTDSSRFREEVTDIHHFQQCESNRVYERKIKNFSFTNSQESRFLALVQDGK